MKIEHHGQTRNIYMMLDRWKKNSIYISEKMLESEEFMFTVKEL